MPTPTPTVTDAPPAADLHGLIGHAVFAGLCNLIPVPFVDDWVRDGIRRRMVRRELESSPVELDAKRVQVLACGYDPITAKGCLGGCLTRIFKIPVDFVFKLVFKKIFRKIFFFLAVKDCVDTFSAVFHEGFLIRHALGREHVCAHCLGPGTTFDDAVSLRGKIEAVRDEVDHRPVERWAAQAFRGSGRLLRQTARLLNKTLGKLRRQGDLPDEQVFAEVDPEHGKLNSMIDELAEEISGEASYLADLTRRLDRRLDPRSEETVS